MSPVSRSDESGADGPVSRAGRGDTRPQHLIVTVFAFYGRHQPITAGGLIRMMAALDVAEPAVRSALSRLKKRHILSSARVGGSAAYLLDPGLAEVFTEGDERIFEGHRAEPGDRWLLAAFSVPESQRHLRHQLRKTLSRRGFGTVGSGLWIAPALVAPHIRRDLERAGLTEYVELFLAEHLTSQDLRAEVAQWWDLDELADHYQSFIDEFSPMLRRWRGKKADPATGHAFRDHVRLVTAWRRLPYLDPGLPVEALPDDWPGLRAEALFGDLHLSLQAAAAAYAESRVRG